MWKRYVFIAAVIIVIIAGHVSASFAQEKDYSFSIGLKTWYEKWDTSFTRGISGRPGTVILLNSDGYNLLWGPTAGFRYKNIYLSGSVAFSSQTEFAPITDTDDEDLQLTSDRLDWDLVTGWAFHPNVSLFLGWKSITQDFEISELACPSCIPGTDTKTYDGPFFGLQGNVPISDTSWSMFGNASIGLLTFEVEDTDTIGTKSPTLSASATMLSSEIGVGYRIPESTLQLTLSYKAQVIHFDAEELFDDTHSGQKGVDLTVGPMLGISWTF